MIMLNKKAYARFEYCAVTYLVEANYCENDTDSFQDHEFLREDQNGKTFTVPSSISNRIPSSLVNDKLKASLVCDEFS